MHTINKERIASIDILRGFVMVLMALDHTRDYFSNFIFSPTDLDHTTVALFLTRWITHFCAPIFVFLVGTGMYLSYSMGRTKKEISWFLFTRGLWLVVVELTLIHFGWTFSLDMTVQSIQVIFTTGLAMITLALIIFLPLSLIFVFGAVLVAGHNILDILNLAWIGVNAPGVLYVNLGNTLFTFEWSYPVIPWIGVSALGYVFGQVFTIDKQTRTKYLWILGIACLSTFVILRFFNVYGEPSSWSVQDNAFFTALSFVNFTKYPPSLHYLLTTLGVAFLLLIVFERYNNWLTTILSIFGKVPFFFYVLHLMVIHALAILIAYSRFGNIGPLAGNEILKFSPDLVEYYGYGLPIVYLMWLITIIILYPLCYWYAGVKRRHRNSVILSYL